MTTRRMFLGTAALTAASSTRRLLAADSEPQPPLSECSYGDVNLAPGLAQTQFEQTQSVLLSLNEDSLLKPWRLRAGLPAPGPELGGWYDEVPLQKTESGGHGFAPGHCFGQWLSALARGYAINRDARTRARLSELLALYAPAISGRFYTNFRFPAYNYDKLVIGLVDAHRYADLPQALGLLERTTDAALPHLPPQALDRDEPQRRWRASIGESTANDYTWDESYTLPENLYIAAEWGAGSRYRDLAGRFLLDKTYFDPLSEGKNVLANHHAYSFCNALSSAMQAYLSTGSQKHLLAASNAFDMIAATQSFATGGWGPNESFSDPASDAVFQSLTGTHRGFETPCGSYAHLKLTRYLLRVTRDGRYGDSMERVLYNTVLGAKHLEPDGHAFYYSDYHSSGSKSYFPDRWPCCSGTLPQVAADYRVCCYFRSNDSVYVNLYLPSTLKWTDRWGTKNSLIQTGDYPLDSRVTLHVRCSRPSSFAIRLRIPAWSQGSAALLLNGQPMPLKTHSGFAELGREWKDGDRIDLYLPLTPRLESIDPRHPNTVALLRGPLVLFVLAEQAPQVTREQLLQAAASFDGKSSGPVPLGLFTSIEDQHYWTYLNVT